MSGVDRYAQWDAAYVLGALAPAERREYEEHVAGCRPCQAAVAELAGMPGLLAQVPAGEVLALDLPEGDDEPVPLAPPPSATPRARDRRRWLAPVLAAAAALVIGGAGGYAVSAARWGDPPVTAAGAPGRLAFSAVEPSSMTAVLDVITVANGTELRVECQYASATGAQGDRGYQASSADYAIWVVDRAGTQTLVRSWTARPDRVMHPSGMSRLAVEQIAAVEIRRVDDGSTVMRAELA